MAQGDKQIREEASSWLASQADRLMMDPDVLEVMPVEAVYEALEKKGADLKPRIDAIQKQVSQDRSRLAVIRLLKTPPGWLVAASLVLLLVYGALWLAGRSILPDTFALVAVTDYEEDLGGAVRAPTTPSGLAQGAEALLAARQSTLGLFPHYDQTQVQRAITHLEPAYEASTDPFLRERIAFFLGLASLMQGNVEAGRIWLENALAEEATGYREKTQALLRSLEEL